MKQIVLTCSILLGLTFASFAQEEKKDIVKIIDELTARWDKEALKLEKYAGLKDYCQIKPYRDKTMELLNLIHHYDTSLFMIVTAKYEANQDPEAKATLDDINTVETVYTTPAFLKFLHKECTTLNSIENNLAKKGGKEYKDAVKALEKELFKYVEGITKRIDLIDEHVHHLKDL
jgi:hypothetical protein